MPDDAAALLVDAQASVADKYRQYEDFAARDGTRFLTGGGAALTATGGTAALPV
jgi:hypothetical protein